MARPVWLGDRAIQGADGRWTRGGRVELDADALVRHAFVCGASGFGKTVFSKGLVEEAILAGIPVIAVDLKGDLASLALTGPLAGAEALRAVFGDEAPAVAAEYEAGRIASGIEPERSAAYASRAHVRVFAPNSRLGQRVALSGLPSFPDPPGSALERDERDELIQALVHGFAQSMYGGPAAVKRNEPAVKVVEELCRWCADRGEPLEGASGIARILELVSHPPLESMGGMPLEEYLPQRDRQKLMQMLNSRLLGAERARYEGPRLSVETLLGAVPPGKVPLSVLYLGHSSDFAEQASILGQLCADVYRWMRRSGGSSGVRLLIYVDELGGGDAKHAFYPSAPNHPPSKAPLNLLVRQGRSAGVAMLLATQNPMSVDVRGLGNINTWAVGRLTRKNDHARIEDLLSRLPEGPQKAAKIVSQLPQGVMLSLSDALSGPEYLYGRWLYSVHRQLSPSAVAAITELSGGPEPEAAAPPPRPPPPRSLPPSPPPAEVAPPSRAEVERPPAEEPPARPRRRSAGRKRAEAPIAPDAPADVRPPRPALSVLPPVAIDAELDAPTEHQTTRRMPRHLAEHETTEVQQTRSDLEAAWEDPPSLPDPDSDTEELLAETGFRARPLPVPKPAPAPRRAEAPAEDDTDELLAETGVRAPPSRRRRRTRRDPEASGTTWLPRDPTDDGEALTITFARPRPALVPSGWVARCEGQLWPIAPDRGVTVGRSPLADLRVDDPRVSRLHVQLQLEGPDLLVRPLRPKNGTLFDGRPLDADLRLPPTASSWPLELGDTEIVISWSPPRR